MITFKSLLQPKQFAFTSHNLQGFTVQQKNLWLALLWILCKHRKSEGGKDLRVESRIQGKVDLPLLTEMSYSHWKKCGIN